MPEVSILAWAALALGAALVGFSKTALPGVNILSVVLFAAVLPARASTGALLVLMLVGDAFATWTYRRHADWKTLVRLAPAVVVGLAVGAAFLAFVDDRLARRTIGLALLGLLLIGWRQRRADPERSAQATHPRLAALAYGSLGGFTTMVANAGGPAMSMYFLSARFPMKRFLGTTAWFFAVMNLVKLPLSAGLGLITASTAVIDAALVPAVVLGALVGRRVASRLSQRTFDRAVLALTVLGAVYLLA